MNIENNKLKKALLIGIPILIVVVIIGGGILAYKTAVTGSKAMEKTPQLTAKAPNNTSTNKSNEQDKPTKVATDKKDTKDTKDTNNATKAEEKNSVPKGNINAVKDAPNINAASATLSSNSTGFEKIFYNTFGQQMNYPKIVNDKENNIVKIYSSYLLGNLNCMKKLGDETIEGKYTKANYYTSLESEDSNLKNLTSPLEQIVSKTNGTAKTNAQNLLDIVNLEINRANNEYMFIKGSTTFSNGMIKSLTFGSSLDETISQVKQIDSSLGCDNKGALDNWQQAYKMLLPIF